MAVAVWLGWGWAGSAAAQRVVVHGVQLPDGSEKVGENRYRSSRRDFEQTLDYFKATLPAGNYPRRSIVNQPGVKAVHIANPSGRKFEGINIYQANDEVRIYVIAAEPPKKAPPKKKAEKK